MTGKIMGQAVAAPTWGVGAGGTRFTRFSGHIEPRNIMTRRRRT